LDPAVHARIFELKRQGDSNVKVAKALGLARRTVDKYVNLAPAIQSNKKVGEFKWREWVPAMRTMQELKKKSSFSQETALIELGDGTKPVALAGFSDQHMGAWSTNYQGLCEMTDEILSTPDLYLALLGDYGHYAIKLRNVLEVADNLLTPEQQTDFLESWFDEIWHKVALATWENHGVERQEKQAGESSTKRLLSRKVTYFNGIGHADIKVGKQIYRGAFSHVFRGRSIENPCHAQMRYMRREGIDRDFAMQGDTHTPGMIKYTDGARVRVAINTGSLQNNSGYAKRYFSLTTHPVYPIIVFHPDRHEMTPFWSIKEAIAAGAIGRKA
jgi:hypothetical protein